MSRPTARVLALLGDRPLDRDAVRGTRFALAQMAAQRAAAQDACARRLQLRADLASERMSVALHDAGCREVWIGAESGSQKVLDAMNKGTLRSIIGTPGGILRSSTHATSSSAPPKSK